MTPMTSQELADLKAGLETGFVPFNGANANRIIRSLIARLEAAEDLMLELRARIIMVDDLSMGGKAARLSDRVQAHFNEASR